MISIIQVSPLNFTPMPSRTLSRQEGERACIPDRSAMRPWNHDFLSCLHHLLPQVQRHKKGPWTINSLGPKIKRKIRKDKEVITNHVEALRTSGDSCIFYLTYTLANPVSMSKLHNDPFALFNCKEKTERKIIKTYISTLFR
jgi:hypothetical protein